MFGLKLSMSSTSFIWGMSNSDSVVFMLVLQGSFNFSTLSNLEKNTCFASSTWMNGDSISGFQRPFG